MSERSVAYLEFFGTEILVIRSVSVNKKAIYPGTFDPITHGHTDVITRAAALFDEVIVAVADSQRKKPCFDLQTRVDLIKHVLGDHRNIRVVGFNILLMDLAKREGANVILRGLRTSSDFEYEFQLAGMNRRLDPTIETIFFTPSDQYIFISSSMVREVAELGGDVSPFVHPLVEKALNEVFPRSSS